MYTKVDVVVEEIKDGSLMVRLNGERIGELGDVKPVTEIAELHELITVREKLRKPSKIVNEMDVEIVRRLALLLAWYITE
jgi:hypothetical protein